MFNRQKCFSLSFWGTIRNVSSDGEENGVKSDPFENVLRFFRRKRFLIIYLLPEGALSLSSSSMFPSQLASDMLANLGNKRRGAAVGLSRGRANRPAQERHRQNACIGGVHCLNG